MRDPAEEGQRWLEQAEEAVQLAGEVVEMVRQCVPKEGAP